MIEEFLSHIYVMATGGRLLEENSKQFVLDDVTGTIDKGVRYRSVGLMDVPSCLGFDRKKQCV